MTRGLDSSRLCLKTLSIVVCGIFVATAISAWAQSGLPVVGRTYAESIPGTPPANATVPDEVRSIEQTPIQGTSMVYSFADATSPSQRTTQYYFLYGTGAIYHDGWKASFGYRPDFIDLFTSYPPPQTAENNAGREVWELYNVDEDPAELNDLSRRVAPPA